MFGDAGDDDGAGTCMLCTPFATGTSTPSKVHMITQVTAVVNKPFCQVGNAAMIGWFGMMPIQMKAISTTITTFTPQIVLYAAGAFSSRLE